MRVVVDDAVFSTHGHDHSLHELLLSCSDGRHLIEVVPQQAPACRKWLSDYAGRVGIYYQQILDSSIRELATSPTTSVVHIPAVPLPDALSLLRSPLSILVENERNDGAFLRAVLRGPREQEWQRALERRWVGFDSGGGMQEIEKRIQAGASVDPRRTYVVFDSDARRPGEPSIAARRLAVLCGNAKLRTHVLKRRERENYLPLDALHLWVEESKRGTKASLRRLLGQYRRLNDEQRHHYNMRRGLKADGDDAPLFAGVNSVIRQALHVGFGDDVGQIFDRPERLLDSWLISDGQSGEMQSVLDEILAML